ncbi:hypothetical protein PVAND_014133 [Polypedilum vanderplanki]|uniref:Zinc finger protein n=1 Tax=Polypedilum vanderplanki TaxID=319348 RepID=A0A9J6CS93_POLVA|nr:hypothetical protein PVAND_014133 [Polypedilum vanderplanki]
MTFEYNKICRLCLNSSNTYLMNIFNNEYNIVEKISELIHLEVFQQDPFPKVICTDCYSNLLIFSEFKRICKNSDDLLRKYQINKAETEVENASHAATTKGNGKCKSIRNSEEMANRIKECAFKKSMTFIENMKNFYFLLNQIEDLETNGGAQVIIKNEISSETLIPSVEINIKNEIIYPNDENIMGSVIQQAASNVQEHQPQTSGETSKRKRRKSNKRKFINGQTMEIDETGNIVARQILVASDQTIQQQQHHQNLQITTTQNENNEMALMLTVKPVDSQDAQTITVGHSQIQPIQIHSNNTLPSLTTPTSSSTQTVTTIYSCSSCHEIFNTTESLRQHLLHAHQILFPFNTTSTSDHQYQVTIPQTSNASVSTIPQVTQQFTTFTHKKYFDSDFPCMLCGIVLKNQEDLIKHMINHTSSTTSTASSSSVSTTSAIPMKVTTIVERDRNSVDITPTDLSSSTTQYK